MPQNPRLTKEGTQLLRKQIAELLNQGIGTRAISRQLKCSTSTVLVVKKILDDPNASLEQDRRGGNGRPEEFDEATINTVMKLRAETDFGPRMLWAILRRSPDTYGIKPDMAPSAATIGRWLHEKGATRKVIGPADNRGFPIDWEDIPGVLAIDEHGPIHWGSDRLYLTTIQDRCTRLALGVPSYSKQQMSTTTNWTHTIHLGITHLLGEHPFDTLFTDNGLGMTIANGWTKQPVRYALSLGARVVYNAPGKPWKNGRLEKWHDTLDTMYFDRMYDTNKRQIEAGNGRISSRDLAAGFVEWTNWYNIDKPHQALSYKSPADVYPHYLPVTPKHVEVYEGSYPELPPQKGIIDAIRLIWNDGRCELWQQDSFFVQQIFGGQYLRIRFFLDPYQIDGDGVYQLDEHGQPIGKNQYGQVIWQQGRGKEPLVVATFNHLMDRPRKHGEALIKDIRFVDFERDAITPPPTNYLPDSGSTSNRPKSSTHASPSASARPTEARISNTRRLLRHYEASLRDSYLNNQLTPQELSDLLSELAERISAQD